MIGSFKNPNDEKKQMDKYLERLRLKQKLVKTQEMINKEVYTSLGVQKPSAIPEMKYQNIQQELTDNTLQLQKAQQNLKSFFKYPQDASVTLDLILQSYSAAEFNQVLPEFITELKGVKDLTPSYFVNQFDRFMTIKKSRGDNLVQIGVNDDKRKIENLQKIAGIMGFMSTSDAFKELSAGQKKLFKEKLESKFEPVVNPETGFEDFERTSERIKTIILIEKDIDKSKNLNEDERTQISDFVNSESDKWIEQEKADREEKGLPDVPITIPASTRSTFYKNAQNELLNQKREDMSKKLIDYFIGESITRGKEVKERLKESFKKGQEKLKSKKEREQVLTEEMLGNIANLKARKSAYDEYVANLEEQNKQIEEQKTRKENITQNLQTLERELGLKVNYKNGTIKIPKASLNQTKEFMINQILRGRNYENLTRKEQQEINVIDRSRLDEIASRLNKTIKPELKKNLYFEKEKELLEIPTFEDYLNITEEELPSRKRSSELSVEEVPVEELKGEEVEEVPIRRIGRPITLKPLQEFKSRGKKPVTPLMETEDFTRLLKVLQYTDKDIKGNPRFIITTEEAKAFEPDIEKIDTSQIKQLYKYSSIPNKIKKPVAKDIPGIRKDLIVHLREQAQKLSELSGQGLPKKSKQYGGFMESILPLLGTPNVKPKRGRPKKVVEPSMISELKPKRGRPKKVLEPSMISEVKPKRGRPKKVVEPSKQEMSKKKHNKINIIKINK